MVPGGDCRVVQSAVHRQVSFDVEFQVIDDRPAAADPLGNAQLVHLVGHVVAELVPMAGRRGRTRPVGPELGDDPAEVAAPYQLWVVRQASVRVDRVTHLIVAFGERRIRACCPDVAGEISIITPSLGSNCAERRIITKASSLNMFSLGRSKPGGKPWS